jgi:hypothetical protein
MSKKIKIKKPKSMFFRGIGKTPAVDWLLIGSIFCCLVIAAGVSSIYRFIDTKQTLKADDISASGAPQALTKTQEEEAMDVLEVYKKKAERHQELLGKAKIETAIEKKNTPSVATSTATSSAATATSTR